MEVYKHSFLDVGGGSNWELGTHGRESLRELMNSLRAVQLARRHPDNRYIVFDAGIPKTEAAWLQSDLPNLYFVQGFLGPEQYLPFSDNSMDQVEMNFLFTSLSMTWEESTYFLARFDYYSPGYIHGLKEACRVLKRGGRLALTEKQQRLDVIRRLLSKNSDLDLDGYLMFDLDLDTSWKTHKMTEIINPNETAFAHSAMEQRREAVRRGDKKEATDLVVYRLEMVKRT